MIAARSQAPRTCLPVRQGSPGVQLPRRRYVNARVLDTLLDTPLGRAGRDVFRFQHPAGCAHNSTRMLRRSIARLVATGELGRNWRTHWMDRWLLTEGLAEAGPLEARDLHRLGERHGPVQIVSYHGLQPGQGDAVYRTHHAVVHLASFFHGPRLVGVLLDGNDLQSNPATAQVRAQQRRDADTRALGQLDGRRLVRLDEALRARDAQGDSVFQAAFRLVDLQQMLDASTATAPALVRFDASVTPTRAALPPAALARLREAVEADPAQVEPFAPPSRRGAARPPTWATPIMEG